MNIASFIRISLIGTYHVCSFTTKGAATSLTEFRGFSSNHKPSPSVDTQLCRRVERQKNGDCDGLCAWDVRSILFPWDSLILTNSNSGKAIALRLANDGYDVCINDIAGNKSEAEEVAKQVQSVGRKSFVYTADVSNLGEVQSLVQASVSELGPLNTMVANAGIAQVKALLDLEEQDLKRMFEVNGASATRQAQAPC